MPTSRSINLRRLAAPPPQLVHSRPLLDLEGPAKTVSDKIKNNKNNG